MTTTDEGRLAEKIIPKIVVMLESLHPGISRHRVKLTDGDFIGDDGSFIYVAEGEPSLYRVLHMFPKERVLHIEFVQQEHAGSLKVEDDDILLCDQNVEDRPPFLSVNDVVEYRSWPHGADVNNEAVAVNHHKISPQSQMTDGWYASADLVKALDRRENKWWIIKNRYGPVERRIG